MAEQFNLQIIEQPEKQEVHLGGNLVIQHMDKISDQLRAGIHFGKPLEVHIQQPDLLDITLIQLLLALHKSCLANQTELVVKASVRDDLVKLIENAGFKHILK